MTIMTPSKGFFFVLELKVNKNSCQKHLGHLCSPHTDRQMEELKQALTDIQTTESSLIGYLNDVLNGKRCPQRPQFMTCMI